jgi:hypothetical protein
MANVDGAAIDGDEESQNGTKWDKVFGRFRRRRLVLTSVYALARPEIAEMRARFFAVTRVRTLFPRNPIDDWQFI